VRLAWCLFLSLLLCGSSIADTLVCSARASVLADDLPDEPLEVSRPKSDGGLGLPHLLGFVGLVGGAGIALFYKSEADERFDEYLTTADPDRAPSLLRESQQYDRRSVIGWVLAQASFVGLFYLFTNPAKKPLIPVEGEPLVRRSDSDVQIGWRLSF
jgi:hypothetical protein